MNISFGFDHGAYDISNTVHELLESLGHTVTTYGVESSTSTDYFPDFAHAVARDILSNRSEYGILICGSGNGMAMSANKHLWIRAGLAWNREIARLARYHNDANILCLPARFITTEELRSCIDIFLSTPFEGGRHCERVEKINTHTFLIEETTHLT